MRLTRTAITDLLVIGLQAHKDSRGFFAETWRDEWLGVLGLDGGFVQDNHARSEERGVLRGLHFQKPPKAQAKLVWASKGAVYDVAVDLRIGSPTFGKWHGLVLSEENMLRFFVPEGFAHGYMTLEAGSEVQYKVSSYYSAEHESGIRWNDPSLAVSWPRTEPVLSGKDQKLPLFAELEPVFFYDKA